MFEYYIRELSRILRSHATRANEYNDWRQRKFSLPLPPYRKRAILKLNAMRYRPQYFVETGTLYGETIWALRKHFSFLHSIELDKNLHDHAVKRLARYENVKLWQGDSATVLRKVLDEITGPALFWLDGHYSGVGTAYGENASPILAELNCIARHTCKDQHLIIVDDARSFNGRDGYPDIVEIENCASDCGLVYRGVLNDMIYLSGINVKL